MRIMRVTFEMQRLCCWMETTTVEIVCLLITPKVMLDSVVGQYSLGCWIHIERAF